MKKLLFIALVAGSLIACNSASTDMEDAKDSTVNAIENATDSLQNQVEANADTTQKMLERSSDSVKNQVEENFEKKDSLKNN